MAYRVRFVLCWLAEVRRTKAELLPALMLMIIVLAQLSQSTTETPTGPDETESS